MHVCEHLHHLVMQVADSVRERSATGGSAESVGHHALHALPLCAVPGAAHGF